MNPSDHGFHHACTCSYVGHYILQAAGAIMRTCLGLHHTVGTLHYVRKAASVFQGMTTAGNRRRILQFLEYPNTSAQLNIPGAGARCIFKDTNSPSSTSAILAQLRASTAASCCVLRQCAAPAPSLLAVTTPAPGRCCCRVAAHSSGGCRGGGVDLGQGHVRPAGGGVGAQEGPPPARPVLQDPGATYHPGTTPHTHGHSGWRGTAMHTLPTRSIALD
jgi:hypothetical protein